MPCTVKKTFEAAIESGNHLLVQLKSNQSTLLQIVTAAADAARPTQTDATCTTGRSRREDRLVEVFAAGDALAGSEWQGCVATLIRVTRRTLSRVAATGMWQKRCEVAYYLASTSQPHAGAWATAIRGHWGIENRNHHVRDVSCHEDKSRIRDNPGIMARTRSMTLNILRANGVTNVAEAFWKGGLSLDRVLKYSGI